MKGFFRRRSRPTLRRPASRPGDLKWYFALSQATAARYEPHVKAAVISARLNTDLKAHFVYDGEDDDLCRWLRANGVTVIFHRVGFFDRIPTDDAEFTRDTASGAFLRVDLPLIDQSDDVVLYTDCDVIFNRHPVYSGDEIRYFAVAPETVISDYGMYSINSGVMFLNLRTMRLTHKRLTSFIELTRCQGLDQQAYRSFYHGLWEELDPRHNWKPYWGYNPDAFVVHFHGPKLADIRALEAGHPAHFRLETMYHADPDAYRLYREELERLLASDDGQAE